MTPPAFHVPPKSLLAGASVCGAPPPTCLDVRRFQIAMHDALLVRGLERTGATVDAVALAAREPSPVSLGVLRITGLR